MKIPTSLLAASLAAGLFPPAASVAQHQGHQPSPGQSPTSADSAQCARAQLLVTGTLDAAMARLETARQANSPAQMRAAVDALQGALRDVKAQLAPCIAMQAAGAHTGMAMPSVQQAPSATPGTPVMAPGSPTDHSKMPMGSAPAARPAGGGKPAAAAPMDHSKMPRGTAPAAKPATGRQSAGPAPMDHSKMPMGKDSAVTPPDASAQAVDPVCGLKVVPATAPRATHQGHTYSFCSEQHRQLFQKNPAKYLPKGR